METDENLTLFKSVKFILTEHELIACNAGKPFSGAGLRGVCAAHMSNKTGEPFRNSSEAEAEIETIRETHAEDYRRNPQRLHEDAKGEKELRNAYGERLLFELLQNAHDAMSENPIGYKGIGFKGVLSVTDVPRIHSGKLSVCFDVDHANSFLEQQQIDLDSEQSAPILRLPFVYNEIETDLINECRRSYSTVIVLPIRSDRERDILCKYWDQWKGDPSILVLLPSIRELQWQCNDDNHTIGFKPNDSGSVCTRLNLPNGSERVTEYHLKTDPNIGAKLAVPIINGDWQPVSKFEQLRCFFPIQKETNPFPRLILHGNFALNPDREAILDSQADTEQAIFQIAELIRSLAEKSNSLASLLDVLKPAVENPTELTGIAKRIWEGTRDALQAVPVPGFEDMRLSDLRILPAGPYISTESWENSETKYVEVKQSVKNWLAEFRPTGLQDLPFISENWESPERESILRHLFDGCELDPAEFRTLALFPAHEEDDPISSSEYWLCASDGDIGIGIPNEIRFRFLNDTAIKKLKKNLRAWNYVRDVGGIHDFDLNAVIKEAVLPALSDSTPLGLVEFLFRLSRNHLPELADLDIKVKHRRKLSEMVQIVTSSEEFPSAFAAKVYAGEDWTGNGFLDSHYRECVANFPLHSPPVDEEERNALEKFYRWVGVAFCPRVVSVPGIPSYENGVKIGPLWEKGKLLFPIESEVGRWDEYCKFLAERKTEGFQCRNPRMRANWMLDIGIYEFENAGAWDLMISNWEHYDRFFQVTLFWSSRKNEHANNTRITDNSYLLWMMRNAKWVPVRGAETLAIPSEVYRPSSITRQLGDWVKVANTDISDEIAGKLRIPGKWSELTSDHWQHWMTQLLKLSPNSEGFCETVSSVYRAYLEHAKVGLSAQLVWTERFGATGESNFSQRLSNEDVYYLDRSDLDELKIPEIEVFPVSLANNASRAMELLNIPPLSKSLAFEIISESGMEDDSLLSERLKERLVYLALACCGPGDAKGDERDTFCSGAKALKIRLVDSFSMILIAGGKTVTTAPFHFPFFHDSTNHILWLTESYALDQDLILERSWGQIAVALVMIPELSQHEVKRSLVANILRVDSHEDLITILRHEGISPTEIEHMQREVEYSAPPSISPSETVDIFVPNIASEFESLKTDQTESPADEILQEEAQKPQISIPATSSLPSTQTSPSKKRRLLRTPGQHRSRQGAQVESAFRRLLVETLESSDWKVSPYRSVDDGRESDVLLQHSSDREFHIEVKSVKGTEFFWSDNEVEKAQLNPERYWLALVRVDANGNFGESDIYFSANPLNDFVTNERYVRWRYTDEVFDGAEWNPPNPNEASAPVKFSFKVKLSGETFRCLNNGFSKLKDYLAIL